MSDRIVITGTPASGKTLFFERLKLEPLTKNFIFFEELARQLIRQNSNYRENWRQFHIDIYRKQIEREKTAAGCPFITDRGTIDTFAFHPETADDVNTTIETEYNRYDAVILLESSAHLGERFYKKDEVREESIETALEIERKLMNVWSHHPGFQLIKARKSFMGKYAEFLDCIKCIISKNRI